MSIASSIAADLHNSELNEWKVRLRIAYESGNIEVIGKILAEFYKLEFSE